MEITATLENQSELIQQLKKIPDFRSKRGQRYPLWVMLLLAVLGVMSGCQSYHALEDFGVRHCAALCEVLGITLKRMPSDTTMRKLFGRCDFRQLSEQFNAWASAQFPPPAQEWFSIDGKSLRGSVQNGQDSLQNFISVVSLYSHQRRIVVAQQGYQNKAQSEIEVVQQLLEALNISGIVVSLDALHAQKKPLSC
jgi:hypothetical protein